jgi:hypothetical protein
MFQKRQPLLLLPMCTNIWVVLLFLKNDQSGINVLMGYEFWPIDAGKRKIEERLMRVFFSID